MSAWRLDPTHIALMVRVAQEGPAGIVVGPSTVWHGLSWYFDGCRHYVTDNGSPETSGPERTAAMLDAQNARSIAARYPGDTAMQDLDRPPIDLKMRRPRLTIPEAVKLIDCYEYQSCETGDFDETEAGAFCRALLGSLASNLPGYDDAPWGWSAETVAERFGLKVI